MSLASRRLATGLFAFLVAFTAIGTRPAPAAAADLTIAGAELEEVRLINAERAKAGLVPVRVDSRLMSLARYRSVDMVKKNYFSHVQPDGRNVFDLIAASGIKWYGAGEIIAWNNWSTLASSAEIARDGWMNSPGHRAVLMSPDFNYVGVGLAVDWATGKKMWTGIFLKGPDRTGAWAKLGSVYSTRSTTTRAYRTVTLPWNGGDVRLSVLTAGFSHYQTQIRVDSNSWRWSSTWTTASSKTFKAWITHEYDFRVRACDKAGNCGNWSTVHDIRR